MKKVDCFVKVEYDVEYSGGNYSNGGDIALIPVKLVDEVGMKEAFKRTTGYDPCHIIHYSEDELYTAHGDFCDEFDSGIAEEELAALLTIPANIGIGTFIDELKTRRSQIETAISAIEDLAEHA
jgi:hypothetical protein